MPCDSVATASAQVSQKFTQEILATEQGRQALIHWLKTQFGEVGIDLSSLEELALRIGQRYAVWIQEQGVMVLGLQGEDQAALDALRDKVAGFIQDLGGALLQQRIAAAIGRRYNVVESATAPNKALVLNPALVYKLSYQTL